MHFDIDLFIWNHYVEIMISIPIVMWIGKTALEKLNNWLEG